MTCPISPIEAQIIVQVLASEFEYVSQMIVEYPESLDEYLSHVSKSQLETYTSDLSSAWGKIKALCLK